MSTTARSFRQTIGLPRSSASIHNSTLIIIDAQNEYANGKLAVADVSSSRKAIADLLTKYRGANYNGRNIIHVTHATPAGAPVFTPDTDLAKEFIELTPQSGEKVITKQFPNSFANTDLHLYLAGLGDIGKKIVLVGYMAHVCVSTTARAGNELGYEVVAVREAVGDRDIPGVEARQLVDVALAELDDAFGTVLSASEVQG